MAHPTESGDADTAPDSAETPADTTAGGGSATGAEATRVNVRRDPRVPLTTAAGLGAVAVVVALVTGGSAPVVTAIAGVVTGLLAAVSLIMAASRVVPVHRRQPGAWRWMAAGSLTWLLGVGVRPVADGTPFVLTFADLLMLVGSVLLAIGCGMSVKPPAFTRGVIRQGADAYLGAASVFAVAWVAVLGPAFRKAEDTGAFFVALALPMVCLLATCAVTPAVAASRSGNRVVGLTGVGLLTAITAAEMATALARLDGDTPPLAAGLVVPAMLLVLAVAPWMQEVRPARPLPAALTAATPLVLVAAATLVATLYAIGNSRDAALVIVAASVVLVLLGRLFVLLVETAGMRRLVDVGEQQLRRLAESTGDVVLVCDPCGVIQEVGPGLETTYGYRPDDLAFRPIFDYIHPEDVPAVQALLDRMTDEDDGPEQEGGTRISCRFRAADGTWRPTESVAARHVRDDDLVLVTIRDISDQVALRNQVTHLTFHDGVTGLPNRAYFEERARDVLTRRGAGGTAVIFLDLDGFTSVNDSVGHASGDHLLGQAARRLRSAVRADDTLARWGGDEFAVLLEGGTSGADAQTAIDLAERLVRAVSNEPFRVADRDIALTASVGVAFAEEDLPPGDLLRNADVAMSRAKELGGRRVEVFATHMHADVLRRLEIASDLQRALLENQFAIEYQPVVDLATSRVTAVEALVRWWRGSTFVPPEQFLGPAEDTGIIVPLSEWILREACREVAAWRASSWDIGLALNLSARQIMAPRFVETVAEALSESGLPASALTLEVIEEMLVEDAGEMISRLSELRTLGVRLAIDDFGTGYASLAFLRQLPVDMIKIDPSFVSGLGNDDTLTLLTRTIVQLGNDLGLIVVAEGIERPEQLDLLRKMGCTRGQGYLVARPMTARGVDSLMPTTTLQNTA
ncbi:PAS domain S-box-containing protein/diguanylate cyclase (GGDEF) domain-containing protein [Microbispora rosea]|uniref:PAS domain S-box-containing protein/diguanylate cyclase (GGDEF) domain-containing protein n=1 Tax=Microbispora rosea TaxID=58117 RepID=A0A1N7DEQ3_9ACTN|nr:PAS domain S-box-containing protein/diguanylate cyclase (GGDEF) domain-containing protein [Microbispora rosea]